jgi:universal stress protein A
MAGFRRIVVAVDLSEESGYIIERAMEVAGEGCEVHLVYVQEPMEAVYMGVVPYGPVFLGMDQVEDRLQKELKTKLDSWAEEHGIPRANAHFLSGSPAREIHRFVDDNGCDLIVLGTHGQKGVQLLLGSTANAVLHGATCDVLAVRVRVGQED